LLVPTNRPPPAVGTLATTSLFIANVGGVYYKIQAGIELGLKKFYIPVGNIYEEVSKSNTISSGPIIISQVESEIINLIKYYQKNITVIPVVDLIDGVEKVFGIDYFSSFHFNEEDFKKFERIFDEVMKASYQYLVSLLNKKNYEEVSKCVEKFDYYSCASLAFSLLQDQYEKELKEKYTQEELYYLKKILLRNVTRLWMEVEKVKNLSYSNAMAFELYGIAVSRLYDAENSLEDIQQPTYKDLAYIMARIQSVIGWLKSLEEASKIKVIEKINISNEALKEYVLKKLSVIETVITYFSSLNPVFSSLMKDAEEVKEMVYEGYYLSALFSLKELETRIDYALAKTSLDQLKTLSNQTKIGEITAKNDDNKEILNGIEPTGKKVNIFDNNKYRG